MQGIFRGSDLARPWVCLAPLRAGPVLPVSRLSRRDACSGGHARSAGGRPQGAGDRSLLPEAHAVLGAVAAEYDYDWKEAGREFGLAMLHDKVSPMVRSLYSYYLMGAGRSREAVQQMERALRDDPVNANMCFHSALCRFMAGQYEEAVAGFLQTWNSMGILPCLRVVGFLLCFARNVRGSTALRRKVASSPSPAS